MEKYFSVSGEKVTEKVIEKSRFITTSRHIEGEEEAKAFVAEISAKYADATHNCYAYICDSLGNFLRFSDNGEPQGTAGMPILEVIKNKKLFETAVVVTRYFGGIKLGAGGLVRAYGGAVADVLRQATRVQMRLCRQADVTVDYSLLKVLRKALQGQAVEQSVDFADKVTLHYLFLADSSTTICDIVSQNTLGKAQITLGNEFLSPFGGV